MWRQFRIPRLPSEGLAEHGYVELVDMLLRSVLPAAFMSVAVTSVGLLLASRKQDPVLLALACLVASIGAAAVLIVLAYRGSAAKGPVSAAAARRWLNFYTIALWSFAAAVGVINLRALTLAHPHDSALVPMLTAAVAFVSASGAGSNVALRPHQVLVALALAITPTVIGFAFRASEAEDRHLLAAFVLVAILLCGFAVAQCKWSADNYAITRRQVLAKLDHALLARRDELTGLANRVQLRERFADVLAGLGKDELLAIHCLDLDRFKAVNDSYGHLVGDALLRAVTERLLQTTRREDTTARLGGDEFVVIQSGIRHRDEALLLARRIVRAVGATYEVEGHEIRIGVSIGVSLAPQDATGFEQLLACADAALYDAKGGESNGGVVFWSDPRTSPSAATGP